MRDRHRSPSRSRGRERGPCDQRDRRDRRSRSRDRSARFERRFSRSRSRSPPRARPREASRPPPRTNRRPCWYAKDYDPIQVGSMDGSATEPHDKALVRALAAKFDPSKDAQIAGNPYATLFVGRLSFATTEETLRTVFAQFGRIRRVRLVRDVVTQQSKGYAFVEFEEERAFRVAYNAAHRTEIDGRTVLVDYERGRVMRGWKPRRLGGGLGGKKESGQLRFGGRDHPFKPPR